MEGSLCTIMYHNPGCVLDGDKPAYQSLMKEDASTRFNSESNLGMYQSLDQDGLMYQPLQKTVHTRCFIRCFVSLLPTLPPSIPSFLPSLLLFIGLSPSFSICLFVPSFSFAETTNCQKTTNRVIIIFFFTRTRFLNILLSSTLTKTQEQSLRAPQSINPYIPQAHPLRTLKNLQSTRTMQI